MTLDQKRARVFGVLYLITFVTSIPALALYQPVLDDPVGYIAGGGQNNQIIFGALLELLLIIANIGTAVVIFPIVKRQSEELALGYVTARLFECTFILVGIVAVLGIVTLQQDVAGPGEGSVAYTLAAIKDWTFLLGPGWVVGWGNGLILGYLMYSSGLVPRKMTWLGLVGGPLIIVSGTLVLFGAGNPGGTLQAVATIPEFLWELSLGLYCTFKGFRPSSPILRATVRLAGTWRRSSHPPRAPLAWSGEGGIRTLVARQPARTKAWNTTRSWCPRRQCVEPPGSTRGPLVGGRRERPSDDDPSADCRRKARRRAAQRLFRDRAVIAV